MLLSNQDTSAWYVATKLHPPLVRVDSIQRPQLEKKLCHFVSTLPLTLLSAPAGYGKTTLLSALPSLLPDYPLAWITIETEDNDPIRFIGLLVTVLQRLHPDCGRSVWPFISGGGVSEVGLKHVISILINDIMHCLPEPIILVLDDLHFVTEPMVHVALEYMLEQLPPNLHVVMSTRHDPPLRLTRLAVRRQLGELRRADLSFNASESYQLLNDILGLSLSTAEVATLQERTEGWPGILCLLAGPLGRMGTPENRAQLMDAITYSEQQVLDFLAEEILLYLPEGVRLFLLQTSILAEMTPAACQAVTGRDDAAEVLAGLYRKNLAIASLKIDTEGEPVYRYHALFARLLKLQLERELSREEIVELHRKAANVQTTPGRAISHYFAAGLWAQAAQLMVNSGTELLYRGMAETVRQWYGGLPAETRNCYTQLNILMARCKIHRGEYADAGKLLDQARETFVRVGDAEGEGDALTSLITLCYHKNERKSAALYVERALKLPLNAMGQVATRLAQAWLNMYDGNWEIASANIIDGLAIPNATGDRRADLVGITYITAPMIVMPGCMLAIEGYCDEVTSVALSDTAWSLGAQELGTWPLLLRGKTEEALKRAEAAASLRQRLGGFPFVGNDLPVLLSILHLARGDMEAAGRTVDKLVQYTQRDGLSSKGVGMFYLHAAGNCLALLGRYDEAMIMQQRLAAWDDSYPLTGYLVDHLKGLIALLTGNETEAAIALERAAQLEIQLPMARVGGSARLLHARLLLEQGNPDSAFAVAHPVLNEWNIASTPGYVLFDGPAILPVLRLVAACNGAGATRMLQLFSDNLYQGKKAGNLASTELLPEPLTPRECDVLKLLIAGHTNHQISSELYISDETVKTHVSHIFRKLDVRSRAQATIRARELGF
mgnify:CR=1 FL=1